MARKTKTPKVRKETYDTPIPDDLRSAYDTWYGQLPKNLQYTGDYDLQGAWLERLGRPEKYEATQNGHLDDYGKKPNHPTFSSGSKWHDPKIPERTGGEWKKAADGSWDFYPGSGNVLTDEQLKDYFDKYEKGNRVHPRNVRQAAKAGDAGRSKSSGVPSGHNAALDGYSGPRVVVNPSTFRNEKDGLCVAFDEAFRILMEVNGFDPVSEPTEKQREFFADTAYNDDERMLRRTILARICTFDTSVTDPTDEQLQEAVEFLDTVMEIGAPQNEWEQRSVQRIRDAIAKAVGQPRAEEETPEPPAEGPSNAAAGGGETEEEFLARQQGESQSVQEDTSTQEEREQFLSERGMDTSLAETGSMDQLVKMQDDQVNADAGNTPDAGEAQGSTKDDSAFANGKGPTENTPGEFAKANADQSTPGKDASAFANGKGPTENTPGEFAKANADQSTPGKVDAAGRQLDDHGRVMAGQKPQGRTLTAGEQAWQDRKNASTQAWKERNGVADAERAFARQEAFAQMFGGQGGNQFAQAFAQMFGQNGGAEEPQEKKSALQISGSRGNIFTINGRRVSSREADAYRKKNGLI